MQNQTNIPVPLWTFLNQLKKLEKFNPKEDSLELPYLKLLSKILNRNKTLKLVSAIFYQIFICHQMIAFQKLSKMLFISFKISSRSGDIQIFVFPSSPLFLPVSHCFRGWWKIDLKVCDVINCLNKNSITHFVWYRKKYKRYDIETLSNDRVLNDEHFY